MSYLERIQNASFNNINRLLNREFVCKTLCNKIPIFFKIHEEICNGMLHVSFSFKEEYRDIHNIKKKLLLLNETYEGYKKDLEILETYNLQYIEYGFYIYNCINCNEKVSNNVCYLTNLHSLYCKQCYETCKSLPHKHHLNLYKQYLNKLASDNEKLINDILEGLEYTLN